MLTPRNLTTALALILALGCGNPGTTLRVVDVVYPDGSFGLKDVEVTTLTDLDAVSGEAAAFYGNSKIVLNPFLQILDRGASRDSFVSESSDVQINYIVDNGVVVAADFDSLMMLTAYTHFEQALLHYQKAGLAVFAEPAPVDYNPAIEGGSFFGFPETDNAAFFALTDSFVLLPMSILQDIPFAMNTGVVTHEMSHRVFYYQAWSGRLFESLYAHQTDAQAQNNFNRAKSTDEGIADYFAASLTRDPVFLAKSVPGYVWEERDLRQAWIMSPSWVSGEEPTVNETFNPYAMGTVLAAALWSIAQTAGFDAVDAAALSAELDISPQLVTTFTYAYGDFERELIRHLPTATRAQACAVFEERYAAVWSRFAGVCS